MAGRSPPSRASPLAIRVPNGPPSAEELPQGVAPAPPLGDRQHLRTVPQALRQRQRACGRRHARCYGHSRQLN